MSKDLKEVERLYNELKNGLTAEDSTRSHQIYAELTRAAEVPKLEESDESEWKSLSPSEWHAVQLRPAMTIEQIAEELSKDSALQITPFEVEVYLKDAHERIEFYVQSLLSDQQNSSDEQSTMEEPKTKADEEL